MTTRLQELLRKLKIRDENDEVATEYLKFYVTKESQPRIISEKDFVSLLAISLDSLKCNKWYVQNGKLIGIVKEEFVSNSSTRAHSSASTTSSTRKEPVQPPRFTDNVPVNDNHCLWDGRSAATTVRDKVLFGIEFSNATFNVAPDSAGRIMSCVEKQLKFLIEHEGCRRPPLPTHRILSFTDIVYLKEVEFRQMATMYVRLGDMLADVGYDEVFSAVMGNPWLLVFCLYMYEYFYLFRKTHSRPQAEQSQDGAMIAMGYQKLLDFIRSNGNDFQRVTKLFKFTIASLENAQDDWDNILKYVVNSEIDVFVMMLKAVVKYEDMIKSNERVNEVISLFLFHPIYKSLSLGFWIICQALQLCENEDSLRDSLDEFLAQACA